MGRADALMAAAKIREGGQAGGHGFKGDVRKTFIDRGDGEEIERLVAGARIALEAEPVDARGVWSALAAGADRGFFAAAAAHLLLAPKVVREPGELEHA